ncbi:hypothetical protein [Microbacterium sp. YY-01]|uniref:hypothetical protein n=1 Tax=Microbacterium sp. YY-01 TaxID=3421634 RepID=UPI003D17952F
MGDGILIRYDDLKAVNEQLLRVIDELDGARSARKELQSAIDFPLDQGKLRNRAGDFEKQWDDRRSSLTDEIKKVQEHVQGVLDGVEEWDVETAAQLEIDVTAEVDQK